MKNLALKRKSKKLSQGQGKTLGPSFGFHFNDCSTTLFNKILWVGDNLTNPSISANAVLEIDYKIVFNLLLIKKRKPQILDEQVVVFLFFSAYSKSLLEI